MTEPLETNHRNRIVRFIHTGIENPKYYPGCWFAHKYFEADKFPVADEVIQENPILGVEIVKIIIQDAKDGWYTRFEAIAFALAKCLLIGSDPVKVAVYRGVLEICKTPEEMLLFNKYTRSLKTGNGQGWCKSVREWYLHKDQMELAKDIARVRARHGRSHKTLIRKSHLKVEPEDYAREAVIKYAIFGVKRARQMIGDKPGTKEILDYLQKVDDLRHCEDPAAAAVIASQNQFTLDHVPGHLLISQDVWDAVLPQMSLRDILYSVQRIHNLGFLTDDSTTTAILVSLLTNQDFINKSEVTPIEVYITLNNYKLKTKPHKAEKIKVFNEKEERRRLRQIFDPKTGLWEWSSTKRHPKEIKNWGIEKPPSQAIITALNKLIDQSWLVTKPTKVRYLITMDMRHHMFKGRHFCKRYAVPKKSKKGETTPASAPAAPAAPAAGGDAEPKKESKKNLHAQCFYNIAVTPGHAAIILALQLLKREKNVKLAVFTEEGIQMASLERNFTDIEEAEFQLRKMNLGRVQLDAPIEWAAKNKQKFDVFINMIDRSTRYMELDHAARGGRGNGGRFGPPPVPKKTGLLADHCPVRALERYRKDGVQDAKLIVMNLASHRVATTDGSHEGVLDIVGIDEFVPKVMDAFALGYFK